MPPLHRSICRFPFRQSSPKSGSRLCSFCSHAVFGAFKLQLRSITIVRLTLSDLYPRRAGIECLEVTRGVQGFFVSAAHITRIF